ncbi:OLC1v1025223C1 [Oldenlandia corymbosa var. corymbosa]|uniref:OLC1v1025223C1 n=1 Tax=Oldenlandia corymbosa var. corymbosa TaxID=529605 RepID=A0AAV1C6K7_OLDCO|nr:OLC1v1025223C1 [Oldenlandia corymbosa var. corymbosa]
MVSIKSILISEVSLEERFLFRQVEPRDFRAFHWVVRYGYKDKFEEPKVFEHQLIESLKNFIRHEYFILEDGQKEQQINDSENTQHLSGLLHNDEKRRMSCSSRRTMDQGVFYLLGEAEVVAKQDSSLSKKFVVNYTYSFLRKNARQGEKT